MKKFCLCLAVMILLAAGGCAADSAPVSASDSPAQTPGLSATPVVTATPEAVSPSMAETPEAVHELDVVTLTAYSDGEFLNEITLEEDADRQVVRDAIMEALLSSYAMPAVDVTELQDYIQIYVEYTDGEVSEHFVFEMDGSWCLQGDSGSMYTPIRQETYDALVALATS